VTKVGVVTHLMTYSSFEPFLPLLKGASGEKIDTPNAYAIQSQQLDESASAAEEGRVSDLKMAARVQEIMAFQQNNSGRGKLEGIARFGNGLLHMEVVSIDQAFPPILDDTRPFLPSDIRADLVLDFLTHPDLSHDLAIICREKKIPVVASGKKTRVQGTLTPPT